MQLTEIQRTHIPAQIHKTAVCDLRGENVVRALPMEGGSVFLMRVPLRAAIAQDFRDRPALDVEVTRELRLAIRRPDPCRFSYRPLGLPVACTSTA